jgi:ribonuclease HI
MINNMEGIETSKNSKLINQVYIKGVSKPNPGPGAASMVVSCATEDYQEWDCVYKGDTTTQRMELMSLHIGLCRMVEEPHLFGKEVTLNIDSPYLRRSLTDWLEKWQAKDWKKAGGDGNIANLDLWKSIYYLLRVGDLPTLDYNWADTKGGLIALSHCLRVIEGGMWIAKTGESKFQHIGVNGRPSPMASKVIAYHPKEKAKGMNTKSHVRVGSVVG